MLARGETLDRRRSVTPDGQARRRTPGRGSPMTKWEYLTAPTARMP